MYHKTISDRLRALFRASVLLAEAQTTRELTSTCLMTLILKLLAEFIIRKRGENENMCDLYTSHYFIILYSFFDKNLPELCSRSFSNSPYLRPEISDTVCLGYVRNISQENKTHHLFIYSFIYLLF